MIYVILWYKIKLKSFISNKIGSGKMNVVEGKL